MNFKKGSIYTLVVFFLATLIVGCSTKEEEVGKAIQTVELQAYEKEYADKFLQVANKLHGKTLFDLSELFSDDILAQPTEELYTNLKVADLINEQIDKQKLFQSIISVMLSGPDDVQRDIYDKAAIIGAYNSRLYVSYWMWDKTKKDTTEFYWIFANSRIDNDFGGVVLYPYKGCEKQKYSYNLKYLLGSGSIMQKYFKMNEGMPSMRLGYREPKGCTGDCFKKWDNGISELIFYNDNYKECFDPKDIKI